MKAIKFIFKNILFPASFFFTIFNIGAYIAEYAYSNDKTKITSFALILGYCLIIAFANNIFKMEMSILLKVGIHYLAFLVPLMAYVITKNMNNAIVGVFIIVTVAYAAVAAPVLFICYLRNRQKNEETKYDSQFK
ncbi:MAG: DUF3021 family protein [Clostridia bacterium]|nr:DUF3021 family protein [Clostridia bacterium]